jgi:hypothetical protein
LSSYHIPVSGFFGCYKFGNKKEHQTQPKENDEDRNYDGTNKALFLDAVESVTEIPQARNNIVIKESPAVSTQPLGIYLGL